MGNYSSEESYVASRKKSNAKMQERYRYARHVLGLPAWKAKEARKSVWYLQRSAPEGHVFPAELITPEKKGPRKKKEQSNG